MRAAIENLMCFALSLKVDLVLNCCSRNAFIFFFPCHAVALSFSHSCLFSLFLFLHLCSTRDLSCSFFSCVSTLFQPHEVKSIEMFLMKWINKNGKIRGLNDLVEFLPRFFFAVNRHIYKCENKTMQKWMIEMLQWRETNPRTIAIWDMF